MPIQVKHSKASSMCSEIRSRNFLRQLGPSGNSGGSKIKSCLLLCWKRGQWSRMCFSELRSTSLQHSVAECRLGAKRILTQLGSVTTQLLSLRIRTVASFRKASCIEHTVFSNNFWALYRCLGFWVSLRPELWDGVPTLDPMRSKNFEVLC